MGLLYPGDQTVNSPNCSVDVVSCGRSVAAPTNPIMKKVNYIFCSGYIISLAEICCQCPDGSIDNKKRGRMTEKITNRDNNIPLPCLSADNVLLLFLLIGPAHKLARLK